MRIEVAALLVAASACGGAQRGGSGPVTDCAGYVVAMRPSLARLARAADAFGDRQLGSLEDAAAAAQELAGELDEERRTMARLRVEKPDLRRAHQALPPALGEMSAALGYLASALRLRDEARREPARRRLDAANRGWGEAVTRVRAICPTE
jgi:hypothetical protein